LTVLARKLMRWTRDNAAAVAATEPQPPAGLYNRVADNWRGLLSIATIAGGDWLARGHKAALADTGAADGVSQLEQLLGDIRDVFGEQTVITPADLAADLVVITSADLVADLVVLEGHPWAEMGRSGKPLTQNRLARMLKPLGIAPGLVGPKADRKRGYRLADFREAFDRYLGAGAADQPSADAPERDQPSADAPERDQPSADAPERAFTCRPFSARISCACCGVR
jgi:putative DNA primase/helicase